MDETVAQELHDDPERMRAVYSEAVAVLAGILDAPDPDSLGRRMELLDELPDEQVDALIAAALAELWGHRQRENETVTFSMAHATDHLVMLHVPEDEQFATHPVVDEVQTLIDDAVDQGDGPPMQVVGVLVHVAINPIEEMTGCDMCEAGPEDDCTDECPSRLADDG